MKFGYVFAEEVSSAAEEDACEIFVVIIRNNSIACGPVPIFKIDEYEKRAPFVTKRYEKAVTYENNAEFLVEFNIVNYCEMPEGYILLEGTDGTFLVLSPNGAILGIFATIVLALEAAFDHAKENSVEYVNNFN